MASQGEEIKRTTYKHIQSNNFTTIDHYKGQFPGEHGPLVFSLEQVPER